MESIQHIKNRIASIVGTRQITQSMRLVSTVRLRAARSRMLASEVFVRETARMAREAAAELDVFDHPYVRIGGAGATPGSTGHPLRPEGGTTPGPAGHYGGAAVIVIGADRGLCGGYNINVCKEAILLMKNFNAVRLFTVGQRIKDYFSRREQFADNIINAYTGISETPFLEDAEAVAEKALRLYDFGDVDKILLVYTRFISMLSQIPTHDMLLPYNPAASGPRSSTLTRYDPGAAEFLTLSTPFYLAASIYGAMLESSVCEQCARTMSMDTAVKNSDEMINSLSLRYNKARQNAITNELADIIGGTKALQIKKGD